ncbi:hypothetical protein V6N13_103293 [Hibiscus sabdariffa]
MGVKIHILEEEDNRTAEITVLRSDCAILVFARSVFRPSLVIFKTIQMSLPGIQRRLEILLSSMMPNSELSCDADLDRLVIETSGCSESELKHLATNAQYIASCREGSNKIVTSTIDDFQMALEDVKPFDPLKSMRKFEPIDLPEQREINRTLRLLLNDFWCTPCISINILLEGTRGTGKSFLAANIGLTNKFDLVRVITPDAFIRLSDLEICDEITTSWKEAQSYALSLIIIDDIERIVQNVQPYSTISNVFNDCLKMKPMKNHKHMVVATTSDLTFLQSIKLQEHFQISLNVPKLTIEGVAKVISQMFSIPFEHQIPVATTLAPVAIKDLIRILELATRKQDETSSDGNGSSSITDIDTVYRMANLMLK